MGNSYGAKFKQITWDYDVDGNDFELTPQVCGFTLTRRAWRLVLSGAGVEAAHQWSLFVTDDPGATPKWVQYGTTKTGTATGPYSFIDFESFDKIVPRRIKLVYAANGGTADPGDVILDLAAKHIPSTLRRH